MRAGGGRWLSRSPSERRSRKIPANRQSTGLGRTSERMATSTERSASHPGQTLTCAQLDGGHRPLGPEHARTLPEAFRRVLPAAASVGAFSPGGGPLACLPGWVRKALLPQVALLAWPQFTPAAKRRLITSYSATGLQRRPARRSSGPVEETCKDEERRQTSETQGESGKGPESRKGDMWQSVEASGGSEEQVKDTRRQ
ncbi:hypothetical protein AGIG_G19658 [Arapaima gigas]